MPSLLLSDGRLIWFAHCPKAGGTSLERAMVDTWGGAVGHLHWGWDQWWRRGGWRAADPPCSPQHLTWADAAPRLGHAPDAVFALVRDPVARMASERRWQAGGRRGRRLGKLLARLPFPLWLRLMLAVREVNPYAFDNHLRDQSDFVPEGAVIFRLEDGLEPVATWLERTSGTRLATPPGHLLRTRREGGVDARSAARIARAFAADFTRFGYAPPEGPAPHLDAVDLIARLVVRPLAWIERRGLV